MRARESVHERDKNIWFGAFKLERMGQSERAGRARREASKHYPRLMETRFRKGRERTASFCCACVSEREGSDVCASVKESFRWAYVINLCKIIFKRK